jgi:hypothetical protein
MRRGHLRCVFLWGSTVVSRGDLDYDFSIGWCEDTTVHSFGFVWLLTEDK